MTPGRAFPWTLAVAALAGVLAVAGPTVAPAHHQFTDVADDSAFHSAVDFLVTHGITAGCGPGLYCPNDPTTRGQSALFLQRLSDQLPAGPQGPVGPAGPAGPTGPAGPAGSSTIIPYASGGAISVTTVLGGVAGQGSAVGFGSGAAVLPVGGVIDAAGVHSFAFSLPRAGTITSMSAFASTAAALALIGSTVTLTAQLYQSAIPDNTFFPVPGAVVTLAPALTGIPLIGTTASGTTTGLAIPMTPGTRLLLVFSASVTGGVDVATALSIHASAGLAIQ